MCMETGRENKREVQLYIENGRETLEAAKVNLENDFYPSSVNRSYYAVFYAANALLATLGEARSKHSGVIGVFRRRFIKTGELPAVLSEIYEDLMNSRQRGDYDLNTHIDLETAAQLLQNARHLLMRWNNGYSETIGYKPDNKKRRRSVANIRPASSGGTWTAGCTGNSLRLESPWRQLGRLRC